MICALIVKIAMAGRVALVCLNDGALPMFIGWVQ